MRMRSTAWLFARWRRVWCPVRAIRRCVAGTRRAASNASCLDGHRGAVYQVGFSPDGRRLVSAGIGWRSDRLGRRQRQRLAPSSLSRQDAVRRLHARWPLRRRGQRTCSLLSAGTAAARTVSAIKRRLDRSGERIFDTQALAFFLGLLLKQVRRRHIDAGAGILDEQHAETRLPQIAGRMETADVRRQAAHDNRGDAAGAEKSGKPGCCAVSAYASKSRW